MDTSVFYHLASSFLGGQALDVRPDGSGLLMMAPASDSPGQLWRLVPRSDGTYALRTSYLGDGFSLDVINDGTDTTPWLAATGHVTGQIWTLTAQPDGTYQLTSDFTGPDSSLEASGDALGPRLSTGDGPASTGR